MVTVKFCSMKYSSYLIISVLWAIYYFTFLYLSHVFSFLLLFVLPLLLSCLSIVSSIVLRSSPLLSSSSPPNPKKWVVAALYGPFPGEEALECSPSHSLPAQCCILINSYQSSSCIQMLGAAQYWLHWKEKMKKTKQAAEKERERERKHHVDKGLRNNGLMLIEDGQNNHCSPLTRLNIRLMQN